MNRAVPRRAVSMNRVVPGRAVLMNRAVPRRGKVVAQGLTLILEPLDL